ERAAYAREGPDEPEGDDHGEERELAAGHGAELEEVETGDALERDDGRAQGAEGHGRGVGDEGEAGREQGRETETHKDGPRHRHRRAESGGSLEERPEAEG